MDVCFKFRVNHISALLSEAECDVARLTQMNDVLKEELRRQERSVEREKHMHNLEYMKNVIFKVKIFKEKFPRKCIYKFNDKIFAFTVSNHK